MSHKPSFSDWILLLLLALIWGSSFILMKKGLEVFRPEQVAALRIAITALVMLPFLLIRWKEIRKGKVKYILLQGLFGNFLPAFLFTIAQQHIDSSLAGILNSLSPVFVLLLGILFFGTGFTWWRIAGMFVAFSGSVLLLLFQQGHGITTNGLFGWLIVFATFSYGISANIIKRYLYDVQPITINAVAFSVMLFPALIILFFTDVPKTFESGNTAFVALGYIAILGIVGSGIASIVYFRLIHNTTALFASSVTYLVPVVALFWGFLAGEPIGLIDYAGMALILSGVYLVGK
ncbi:MAG: DMT family transporter [Chitinophagaceae bacterium]|nr:DMT family transporter [Chitinophagaceae bacterium]